MPKKSRQKTFVSDEYILQKCREGYPPAYAEFHVRQRIAKFLQLKKWEPPPMQNLSEDVKKAVRRASKTELQAWPQGVGLLFKAERDEAELRNKGRVIRLYVHIDDTMTRNEYIANWPIVSECLRRTKESQGFWNTHGGRFFEMLEWKRTSSGGRVGYGKLAEMINRRIERQIRAKRQNKVIEALDVYNKKTDKENMEEAIRRGYDTSVDYEDANKLLRYFDFSENQIKEIISEAEKAVIAGRKPAFAVAYDEPVTASQIRAKLLKYRRNLSK